MSKKSILAAINRYVKVNYTKANIEDFLLGAAPYNSMCHLNSVQAVKEGKATSVFLCYAIEDDGSVCVHFINGVGDKYQDNTWGWLYKTTDYYIIKEVAPSEYDRIWTILSDAKKMLVELNSSWIHRFLFDIKTDRLV